MARMRSPFIPRHGAARRQAGLTLIELMIAVVLSLFITAALIALFLNASRSYSQDEQFARMLENGRFAIRFVSQDLQMAHFWGELTDPTSVTNGAAGTATGACPTTGTTDCGGVYNIVGDATNSILYWDGITQDAPASILNDACLADEKEDAGNALDTAVLGIKRVAGVSITGTGNTQANTPYLNVSGSVGSFRCSDHASGATYWRYRPVIYYVNENDELCRKFLAAGSNSVMSPECLIQGVEYFVVEFGIDTDAVPDGVPNLYVSQTSDAAFDPTEAVSARIHVLVRSLLPDHGYRDTKTYNLGANVVIEPSTDNTRYPDDEALKFYRRVVTKTIALRNPARLMILN